MARTKAQPGAPFRTFIRIDEEQKALVASREKAEEAWRRNEARLESLLLISQYQATSLQDLLDFVLAQAIKLTWSKIGYIYFYDEETKKFTLNTWSQGVMQQCSVVQPQTVYELDKTGIWGEAVRQRRAIIVNDFNAPHPLKKGTPPGHAPLLKFLTIPVFDQGHIVAVVGAANKESDYDDSDIRQLTLMMDSVWKIVQRTKTELALHEAEWKFQALFEKGPIGVAYHEMIRDQSGRAVDYRILDANAAYRDLTGIDPRGKTVKEAFPGIEQDPFDWIGMYEKVVRTGESVRFEQFFLQNGRYYDCTAYRYKPDQFVVAFMNVTERKNAEKALQESEARYRSILEASPDAIAIVDLEKRVLMVSPSACSMFGYDRESDMTGRPISDFLVADHRSRALSIIDTMLEGKQPGPGEYRGVRADGTTFDEESSARLIRDAEGNPAGFVLIARDITERKLAEKKLKASEERLRNLVWDMQVGVILQGPQAEIVFSNPKALELLGLTEDQLLGKTSFDPDWNVIHEDGSPFPGYTHPVPQAIARRSPVHGVVMGVSRPKNGDRVWLLVDAEPRLNDEGAVSEVVCSFINITDRKVAEEALRASTAKLEEFNSQLESTIASRTAELQASNKELEGFAYSISHDLRAPLRAMEGFSDHLLKKLGDSVDAESIHHLERIKAASLRMGLLINDLLKLSLITRLGFARSVVDLSLVASRILLRFGLLQPERSVRSQITPELTAIGDERLLTILMEHLLDNAWKFTACRETGFIVVGSRRTDGKEVYFIQDNGSGFDMAWSNQLFKPFTKLEGIESGPGTGIGLVTAAKIVERHGGKIWAESAPGKGATFYFTLVP